MYAVSRQPTAIQDDGVVQLTLDVTDTGQIEKAVERQNATMVPADPIAA